MTKVLSSLLTCVLAVTAYAQPAPREGAPPDRPEGRERPDGPRDGAPREGPDLGPREGPGREGPGREGMPGREGPGRDGMEFPRGMRDPFERMRGYLEVVNRYAELSRDATSAGVAAVVAANDILRPRGTEAAVTYFTQALETAKNPAVKRAIRLQLVDLYKVSGQQEKALEHLTELIQAAPAEESAN